MIYSQSLTTLKDGRCSVIPCVIYVFDMSLCSLVIIKDLNQKKKGKKMPLVSNNPAQPNPLNKNREIKEEKRRLSGRLSLKIPKKSNVELVHLPLQPPIPEEAGGENIKEEDAAGGAEARRQRVDHDAEVGPACYGGGFAVEVVFDAGADLEEEPRVVGDDAVDEDGGGDWSALEFTVWQGRG